VHGDSLPDQQVHFVSHAPHELDVLLSTNASRQVLATLRSDARFIDGRNLTAAPYGYFSIADHKYFLFYGFICDDLYLKGRAWDADWIPHVLSAHQTNGTPNVAEQWRISLESSLTGTPVRGPNGAAATP